MSPRLFAIVASGEARRLMSYPVDFWLTSVVGFVVDFILAWFLWAAIFAASGQATLGGFDRQGMVMYYVLAILVGKLVRGADHETQLAEEVYQGSLTRYLVFPTSYFAFKYAQRVGQAAPGLLQALLFGSASLLLLDVSSLGQPSLFSVLAALVAIALGNLHAFTLAYLLESFAFWADNVWSLEVLMRFVTFFLGGQMVPLELFPAWARGVIAWLPFRFFFHFPAMTFAGRVGPGEWLGSTLLCLGWLAVLGAAGHLAWRRGFLRYTGVGI